MIHGNSGSPTFKKAEPKLMKKETAVNSRIEKKVMTKSPSDLCKEPQSLEACSHIIEKHHYQKVIYRRVRTPG